jgi:hypothetical protein
MGFQPMAALCIDCGLDTAPNDDRRKRGAGKSEYYMVRDSVWEKAGMSERKHRATFLCIGCLEARLGRMLTARDFTHVPINRPDRWKSPRLNARLSNRANPEGR